MLKKLDLAIDEKVSTDRNDEAAVPDTALSRDRDERRSSAVLRAWDETFTSNFED